MLLLTITETMVEAIEELRQRLPPSQPSVELGEPDLSNPQVGNPISHGQVLEISRYLTESVSGNASSLHLADLLRGSQVYIPPPKPKAEPSQEYKDLMARLRYEEDKRAYHRMTNPALAHAPQQFSSPSSQNNMSSPLSPFDATETSADDIDDITYADANRQMMLVINVLVTIIACGVGIWVVARSWPIPLRLALSMGGAGIIGVAEVVIYAGYIQRLKFARDKERKKVEEKTIIGTWVVGRSNENKTVDEDVSFLPAGTTSTAVDKPADTLRFRAG